MLRLGFVLSWLWLIAGVFKVGTGFYAATVLNVSELPSYLGRATTGEAIDSGLVYITIGVALGLLAIIARNSTRFS